MTMAPFRFNFPQWDSDLLVLINSKRSEWLDSLMTAISNHWVFAIVCAVVCVLIAYKCRKNGLTAIFFLIGGLAAASGLNNLLKIIVRRPRPCESLLGSINILEDCGDAFSFFSAHSSNAFCLALFSSLLLRNKWYAIIINIWAVTVAYSRLYVGKHYPLDVLCGIIFGSAIGFLTFELFSLYKTSKLQQT